MGQIEFLRMLCCPACKGDLEGQGASELHCAHCRYTFPIIEGIPVLFPCNVKERMPDLFGRYWDSEEKAQMYDHFVEGTDIFGSYNHLSEINALTRYYIADNLDLVLDAGCGNGRFLMTLPQGCTAIGIDASLNLLRIAKRQQRGDFLVCCELEHLPFRDNQFGTVISCRVIQHIRDQRKAVQELVRVARENGSVILQLYNRWNLKNLYKNIRMSNYGRVLNHAFSWLHPSLSPFEDWGLSYDRYNGWFEVKRWLKSSGAWSITGQGAGFGYHKYLFEPFCINAVASKYCPGVLRFYYRLCLGLEQHVGGVVPLRYAMEKFVIRGVKGVASTGPECERSVSARIKDRLSARVGLPMARREVKREARGIGLVVRENRYHLEEAIGWLKRAQDATPDSGVSRGYSVAWNQFFRSRGWQPSYPETTGYIIPTMLDCASYCSDPELRRRAVSMADWEIAVQLDNGAVMGGTVNSPPSPAVFNTGQVILGWLRAFEETGALKYLEACERAGSFLLSVQDRDGAWRKGNSRFANAENTTYNSRVGWSLILLGTMLAKDSYIEAGCKNIDFTLARQRENGWFEKNSLDANRGSLLHTICYAAEGVLGAGQAVKSQHYLERASVSIDSLARCVREDGSISGRLDEHWNEVVQWNCLTGNAQLAGLLLRLYLLTGEASYLGPARRLIRFLKSTQNCVSRCDGLRGGIKGAFPFDGDYGKYEVLNWATKFFVDAILLAEKIEGFERAHQGSDAMQLLDADSK